MSNPGKDHWEGVKWFLRYLKGTFDVCLVYRKKEAVLEGFADTNLGGCEDLGKSTTGFVFTIGGNQLVGCPGYRRALLSQQQKQSTW